MSFYVSHVGCLLSISLLFLFNVVHSAPVNETFTTEELLNWTPPLELKTRFPFFHSGFDKEGSPVFVIEYGKWDIRGFLESDKEDAKKEFDKYFHHVAAILTHPENIKSRDGSEPSTKFIVISDIDGYDNKQLIHSQSVQKYLYSVRVFVDALRKQNYNIKKGYFVNSNFLFNSMWNLMKPIFGETINFMELYGTKMTKWRPKLLEHIEQDQLPEWLGGRKDHKPLKVYG